MLFVDRALVSVIFGAVFALVGCSSTGGSSPVGVAKAQVTFIDLRGFDRDLAASLSATQPKVDVTFVEPVSPNALPERVQSWMASVEDGGGQVKVTTPPSSVTAKSPLLLISAISTLWSAGSTAAEMAKTAMFRSARGYDAEIILKLNDKGQSVVDRIVFVQKKI